MFSHLSHWKHGELVDPDSLAHPLVHLAWRALAIAWQETHATDKIDVEDHPLLLIAGHYEAEGR